MGSRSNQRGDLEREGVQFGAGQGLPARASAGPETDSTGRPGKAAPVAATSSYGAGRGVVPKK
jgi:hypothetical protein